MNLAMIFSCNSEDRCTKYFNFPGGIKLGDKKLKFLNWKRFTEILPKTKTPSLIYEAFCEVNTDLFTKILETRYIFR
jgi:hypothetical protein